MTQIFILYLHDRHETLSKVCYTETGIGNLTAFIARFSKIGGKVMSRKMRYNLIICGAIVLGLVFLLYMDGYYPPYIHAKKLIQAIETEDVAKVQELLENGVDPNVPSFRPSWVDVLLEGSPERPLSIACRKANLEIVKLLIEHGATAEPNPDTGWCPLWKTIRSFQPDDVEIVSLLLENGADPINVGTYEDPGPLVAAKMRPLKYDETKANGTFFGKEYDEETAKGITEIVRMLLGDQSINIRNGYDQTLLVISVQKENLYLAEYLLSAGCDTSLKDYYGKTALDYALESGNEDLIALLSDTTSEK